MAISHSSSGPCAVTATVSLAVVVGAAAVVVVAPSPSGAAAGAGASSSSPQAARIADAAANPATPRPPLMNPRRATLEEFASSRIVSTAEPSVVVELAPSIG